MPPGLWALDTPMLITPEAGAGLGPAWSPGKGEMRKAGTKGLVPLDVPNGAAPELQFPEYGRRIVPSDGWEPMTGAP